MEPEGTQTGGAPQGAPETTAPAGGQPAGQPQPEATQAAPAIDMDQLADRFGRMMDERFEQLRPAEPEQEPTDPYAGLIDAGYDPQEVAGTRQVLDAVIQSQLAPVMQQNQQLATELARLRGELDAGDLEEMYPALQQEETAERVLGQSAQIAQRLGNPELATHPQIIELAFLAELGRQRAASETPAGGTPTELERAGGASPGEPESDPNDRILAAGGSQKVWGW